MNGEKLKWMHGWQSLKCAFFFRLCQYQGRELRGFKSMEGIIIHR